jgi:hypothetical protein
LRGFWRLLVAGLLVYFGLPAKVMSATARALAPPTAATAPAAHPGFILQTRAGLSAYAQITSTIPLTQAAGVYVSLDLETDDYLLGTYQLSNRPPADTVKLMIHREGWAVAYHERHTHAGRMLDWPAYDWEHTPGIVPNMPEQAIGELAAALGITEIVTGFYDFRHSGAQWVYLHWSLELGYGTSSSTLHLPLLNTYFDRGFGLATAGYTAQLWLNGEQLAQVVGGSQQANRATWGPLASAQLRSGYTNALEQRTTTFLTPATAGGVGVVFSGSEQPFTAGQAYSRTLALDWPAFLGSKFTITDVYLPITTN